MTTARLRTPCCRRRVIVLTPAAATTFAVIRKCRACGQRYIVTLKLASHGHWSVDWSRS